MAGDPPPSAFATGAASGGRGSSALAIVRALLAYTWAIAFLAVVLPIGLLVYPFDRKQRYHDVLAVVWARGILALVGVRVEASGVENAAPDHAYVVVSNHQSTLDIPAVLVALAARIPLRFVAKRSIFWVPVLGWGMRLYGHAPVGRDSVKGSLAGLEGARRHVARRWSTFFFPEGTRTRDGSLQPFRLGAFRIASSAGARVLPISVDGSFAVMPRHRLAPRPGVLRVTIHPPLPAPDGTLSALRTAAAQCQEVIATHLGGGSAS